MTPRLERPPGRVLVPGGPLGDHVPTKEAAEALGVTQGRIRQLRMAGMPRGPHGQRWASRASLRTLKAKWGAVVGDGADTTGVGGAGAPAGVAAGGGHAGGGCCAVECGYRGAGASARGDGTGDTRLAEGTARHRGVYAGSYRRGPDKAPVLQRTLHLLVEGKREAHVLEPWLSPG